LQGDPVATLTSRIWLPPITDQDRERVQNHLTLFAVAENLDLMPQTTPARELARLKAESLAGLDAHIVLTNAKVPPYLAVLTLDWSRASRDSIQRRCRVSTGAAPAYADLFQKIATTAQASDETLYAETPFVAAAGPVTLGTSPAVTALAWKLDAAAFKADVGTPPDTTLFFELTTITGIHAN
jgi:hypothetical protein